MNNFEILPLDRYNKFLCTYEGKRYRTVRYSKNEYEKMKGWELNEWYKFVMKNINNKNIFVPSLYELKETGRGEKIAGKKRIDITVSPAVFEFLKTVNNRSNFISKLIEAEMAKKK